MHRTLGGLATSALIFILICAGGGLIYRGFTARTANVVGASPPPPTVVPRVSSNLCSYAQLKLQLPVRGVAEKDWLVANYSDQDPIAGAIADYTGARGTDAVTYDGHAGIDFEVPSFRAMDSNTPIFAAADGIVEEVFDLSFDRNMTCSSDRWNYVKLRHINGFASIYAHLKKNSAKVRPGARVPAGTPLGVVGSSGCSGYPHLHLEVLDCEGRSIDIMKEGMFVSPPSYARSAPATVMETVIRQPVFQFITEIQDPGLDDNEVISIGHPFSAGVTISHLKAGDLLRIDLITPQNSMAEFFFERQIDKTYSRSHWWADFTLDQPGSWVVQFKINGRLQTSRRIGVTD